MRIAVFCSCSDDVSAFFLDEMERLGETLADSGHQVVYGGASGGCMGALARGVLRRRGHLIGVVPEMDFMDGSVQEGLSERLVVPTLSARKTTMNELADGFLVFPGGYGTLDEAFEVLANESLRSKRKPIVFYNFLGAWSPLLEAMHLLEQQRLIRHPVASLLQVLDKPEQVREHFKE